MKKCLKCGCECEDSDNACFFCGYRFAGNSDVGMGGNFDFHAGSDGQHSSHDSVVGSDSGSSQESAFLNQIPPGNEGNKLFNSLWILVSFIPYINGFGIIYAGKKTSRKGWIVEGVFYELLVIVHLLSSPSVLTFSLIFLSLLLSIVRSVMIISKYKTILNRGNYKKLDHRIISLALLISSLIPFLNGVGFIYYGNKYSRFYLLVGLLFELVWMMVIVSFSFIPINLYYVSTVVGIGFSSLVVSGMCMISLNFDCEALYHNVNNSPIKIKENSKKISRELYDYYKEQFDDLKDVFDAKEKKVRNLIEEHFGSGNITSGRFLAVVDNSHENVYRQLDSGYDLINYTSEPSDQVEKELLERINYINSINEEMEKLTVELVLNMHEDDKSDDNIKSLVKEMEDLIGDINKYE